MLGSKYISLPVSALHCNSCDNREFRDDMHLGPAAMKMIGEGIAQDIASNHGGVGWFAHEVNMKYEGEDKILPMDAATRGLLSLTPSASPATTSPPDRLESQLTQCQCFNTRALDTVFALPGFGFKACSFTPL